MQNIIDVCNPYDFSKVGDVELVTDDDIENFVANVGKASWMCSMCADNSSDLATYSHLEKGGVEFKNA